MYTLSFLLFIFPLMVRTFFWEDRGGSALPHSWCIIGPVMSSSWINQEKIEGEVMMGWGTGWFNSRVDNEDRTGRWICHGRCCMKGSSQVSWCATSFKWVVSKNLGWWKKHFLLFLSFCPIRVLCSAWPEPTKKNTNLYLTLKGLN